MKKNAIYKLFYTVFSLFALGFLAYLSMQHINFKTGRVIGASACNINATFNCDAVIASQYSELFGIPVSIWGIIAILIALSLYWGGHLLQSQTSYAYARLLTYLNAFVCVVYAAIAFTFLSTYCPFCIYSYIALALSTLVLILEVRGKENLNLKHLIVSLFTENKSYLGVFALIPILSLVMYRASLGDAYREMEKNVKFLMQSWQLAKTQDFPDSQEAVLGSDQAIMEIVEFADFNCVHCKHAAPVLHAFTTAHPDVRFRLFHFPLDSRCNDAVQRVGASCEMAKAAFCAYKLTDNGWSITDEMFAQPRPLDRSAAIDLVLSMSDLSEAEVSECVNAADTEEVIRQQARVGVEAGVKGTPSIYINGKAIRGGQHLPVLRAIYKELKANQRK